MTALPVEQPRTTTSRGPRLGTIALGVGMGILGFMSMEMTGAGFSVSDDLPLATMVDKLETVGGAMTIGGGIQALLGLGLVIFGALVRRTLLRSEPEGSLTPTIAWGGALVSATMVSVGAALSQLIGATATEGAADPAILLAGYNLSESFYAGAWCALALTAGAVAFAGLTRGSVSRWLAGVSAFIAVLLLLAQVVVPWAGWFPALVWVLVASIGLRTSASRDVSV